MAQTAVLRNPVSAAEWPEMWYFDNLVTGYSRLQGTACTATAKPSLLPMALFGEEEMSSVRRIAQRELSPSSLAFAFAAGFLAVLTFYEAVFLLFYIAGVIPIPPFSMKPMPPFGVPEVLSQSFWGGVWGILFLFVVPRYFSGIGYWVASAVIGGTALTLVYMFIVVPLKTGTLPRNMAGLFVIGWLLNAAWGIGWVLFLKLFNRITRNRAALKFGRSV
jgi:hypothetical protein